MMHAWRWTRRDRTQSTTWQLRCSCGIYLRQQVRPPSDQLASEHRAAFIIFRDSHPIAGRCLLSDHPATDITEDYTEVDE
jgi:hypothetical protein